MGKKKKEEREMIAPTKVKPNSRIQNFTTEMLRHEAETLREMAETLEGYADMMIKAKIEQIPVLGDKLIERSYDTLKRFLSQVVRGFESAKWDR